MSRRSTARNTRYAAAVFTPLVTVLLGWLIGDFIAGATDAESRVPFWVGGTFVGIVVAAWEFWIMIRAMERAEARAQLDATLLLDKSDEFKRSLLEDTSLEDEFSSGIED